MNVCMEAAFVWTLVVTLEPYGLLINELDNYNMIKIIDNLLFINYKL